MPPPRAPTPLLESFATKQADLAARRAAGAVCLCLAVGTMAVLPAAAGRLGAMPGFPALSQGALLLVHGLTAWLFFSQYRHTRAVPLLVLGAGGLFTTLMIGVQLLCTPNMLVPGLLLGSGPATLTWLWTFWHLGPPLFTLPYAALEQRRHRRTTSPRLVSRMLSGTIVAVVLGSTAIAVVAMIAVEQLPRLAEPDGGYRALTTSGIGPMLCLLTVAALAVLWRATRLRSVLQLWLGVSLLLLLLDNLVTDLAAARGTLGWVAGRLEALLAGLVILAAYARELGQLYRHAEATALEREAARAVAQSARTNLEIALDASEMGEWELDLLTGHSRRTLRHDRIFGYATPQPAWGWAQFMEHVLPEDRPTVGTAIEAAMRGQRLEQEFRIRRRDDSVRWVALWGRTSFDAAGRAALISGCLMDTTRRREIDARLRKVERMEAVGQVTGGMAHDFNNLLTVMLGSLDLILHQPDDAERVVRLARNATVAGRRGTELTENLLAFARGQVRQTETIGPTRLLGDFLPLLQRCAGDAVVLELYVEPELQAIRIDPGQFHVAMLNLVGNARDAMPDGGALRIDAMAITIAPGDASEVPPGEYVQVAVGDTGVGMDAATQTRAFEPFFSTKEIGQGTGLGLSQVYGFVQQAGGHCRIDSVPGQGCRVSLYFPGWRADPRARAVDVPIPLRRARGGEVVLVVEDDELVRELAGECLAELGYGVMTASDARIALDLLRYPTRIDILFSDVVMPGGMNGAQLTEEARRLRPNLKVLLTSGYTATAAGGLRELPPDVTLLRKPYLREDLAARLQSVLAS